MDTRRRFLKHTLLASVYAAVPTRASGDDAALSYELTRQTPARLFDGKRSWVHARGGIVPGAGDGNRPAVVITMNTMHLAGTDVFKSMWDIRTDDLGETWSEPREVANMAPRRERFDGKKRPVAASDFWPRWHAATGELLGTGHTVVYTPDWTVTSPRPRSTVYSVYDAANRVWRPWKRLAMPDAEKFHNAGAGCTQRYDLRDGTILLPIYFYPPGENSRVAVLRCRFDGETLRYESHGEELSVDDGTRGLHEPSLTRFGGTFFMTIRNDKRGYVTRSDDGLHFEPIRPWRFDDGEPLGNYNTQQHWVRHSDRLHLVYTRRGADNDHVFRHRAPLFLAEVDPEKLRVIRESERVLVPERGARLGNFGVTEVSPEETWVTVAELMQPRGVARHGSDGSLWVARLRWSRPNRAF